MSLGLSMIHTIYTNAIESLTVGNCIDRQISVTETVKVANHLLNITVPACSDTFVPGDNAVDLKNSLLARHVFQARNLAANMERDVERRVHEAPNASPFECSNPAICQCALPCEVSGYLDFSFT